MASKKLALTEDEQQQLIDYEQQLQSKIQVEYDRLVATSKFIHLFYISKSIEYERDVKEMMKTKICKIKSNLSNIKSDERLHISNKNSSEAFIKAKRKILNNSFAVIYNFLETVKNTYKIEVEILDAALKENPSSTVGAVDFNFVKEEFKERLKKFSYGGNENV